MSSRERTLTAIARAKPDRVPVDFSANADTLARLKHDLGCSKHLDLLDRLGVDIVDLRGVVDPVYRGPVPQERSLPGALALQRRIEAFFNDHLMPLRAERWHCNHAFDKLLAAAGAWAPVGTRLRWPYNWFDPSVAGPLGRLAREHLPELFDNP